MAWFLIVLACIELIAPAQAVVGGAPAAPPEPDAAVVFTQKHGYSSRLEGLKDEERGYYTFAGIRYAEPPIGPRRFQRPVRRYLAGEINATRHCPPCVQPDPMGSGIIGHEDCLCLNVFSPKMPGEERGSPVIFFIHGGNYRSGSIAAYGGQHFAQQDTILVTAQYRLGSLGYLSTGQKDASGNTGLFDLRAAMTWINDYIEFFGGDKSRVVVMGQGSGGRTASLMGLSGETPREGRSATGVAALSGAPLSPGAVESNPKKHAEELARQTGCPKEPAERLLRCLRKLPAEKIIQADRAITSEMVDTEAFLNEIGGNSGVGVRVEGSDDLRGLPPLIAEEPSDSIKKKHQLGPMLTGVTSAETSRAVFGKYGKFLSDQLEAVQDFIKKDVIGGLKKSVQTVQGLAPIKLPGVQKAIPLLDYYQAIFDNSMKAVDGLAQIAEATGDALFNFPAYQSVKEWSAGAPALMYSFEHVGNLSKGYHFVPGIALTQDADKPSDNVQQKSKGPAHGDELAYLFEPLDKDGNSLNEKVSDTDAEVRKSFVGLFAKFARNLSENKTSDAKLFGFIPYSMDGENYLKIGEKITLDKNFRFCQIGLWGEMSDRLMDAFCKNHLEQILKLPKLISPIAMQVDNAGQIPVVNGLGLLGMKSNTHQPRNAFNSINLFGVK
ncbi:fatty acyl-CoA hydrolase precursor, medium chain [Pieris napi]|uniref:fatty acyl-CoA hydrolase precursor, medium chain n=1 Tax=Pieris napi TaxID=78633 RepID=UPI001FB91DBD|nr:fatty acyl-CoA hydrolase precursor, medium chain [Pieris napi]